MLFAFALAPGEYIAGGALELDCFSCRRRAVVCSFLQRTKLEDRCCWATGFQVKTVVVIFVEGFPNRFSLVGFIPSRSCCRTL